MSRRALSAGAAVLLVLGLAVVAAMGSGSPRQRPAAGPAQAPSPTPTPTPTPAGEQDPAITAEGIAEHLDALQAIADSSDGNRAAGTPGDRATVEHLVSRLEAAGWQVRTQDLRVPVFVERSSSPRLTVANRRVRQVRTLAYSGPGDVTARVRPIRLDLGRTSDSGCRDGDFGALREGEIALVQRGTCFLAAKARNAQEAGAGAVIIANDGLPGRTRPLNGTLIRPGLRIPALAVGSAAVRRLAGRTATVTTDVISERATVRNVLAESPAAAGADRVVMAGAHLDSVDEGPGINDNGSGVAALLEAAEALRDEPVRLGFWAAEELGLHGSRRYVRSLSRQERRRITAYVNLDMVGTPDGRGRVYGDGEVDDALREAGRRLRRTDLGSSSDHAPFRRAGIPVGGLYTGTHACYHRACDTAARVNRALTLRMARVAEAAIRDLGR